MREIFLSPKVGLALPDFRSYDQDYLDGSWSNSGRAIKVHKTSRLNFIWLENWVKCSRSSKRNKNRKIPERGISITKMLGNRYESLRLIVKTMITKDFFM